MPPRGGKRIPKQIIATSVENPDDTRYFSSLLQAAKAFELKSHNTINTALLKGYEINGYRLSYLETSTIPVESSSLLNNRDDSNAHEYTFFEEVDDLFKGSKVRYFENENGIKQISVLDVINVMMGNANPRMNWLRLQSQHEEVVSKCYMHRFPGQGSRETSVTDITTIIEIINILPGPRAARFRMAGAKVLVRVLGGDPMLIDELNENAERMSSIKQDANNPLNIFALPEGASSNARRSLMFSPSMQGKTSADFRGPCTYIILFNHDGRVAIKFGSTSNFRNRIRNHERIFTDYKIWMIMDCKTLEHALETEQLYKDKMEAYIHNVLVGGKTQTEIILNITPEYAEEQMRLTYATVCETLDVKNSAQSVEFMKLQIEMLKLQQPPEVHRIQLEIEKQQLEIKHMELTLKMKQQNVDGSR
jgi:hypothetical protein